MKKLTFIFLVVFGVLGSACHAGSIVVVESPFSDSAGDDLNRGFYVENYGADNLSQVVLQFFTHHTGVYETSLTVRIGTYDGAIVGETKYLSTSMEADVFHEVVYDFGGIDIPVGSLLTFTQEEIGSDELYYNTGLSPHPQITQTNGTAPPLDSFRRDKVGVTITAIPEPCTLVLLSVGGLMLRRRRRA
jgi:hypothetical protein